MTDLFQYGWNTYFEEQISVEESKEMKVGRVVADFGQKLRLISEEGDLSAQKAPAFFKEHSENPAVGDWVLFKSFDDQTEPMIHRVLKRKTKFSRAAAGIQVKEQVVAANVDIVFIIQSLNQNFNLKRMERYLIAAWDSGARPVVVLTKSDLCCDLDRKLSEACEVARGVDVLAISSLTGQGMEKLQAYLSPGKTIAFLGSSGVGKSTLVNTLSGKEQLKTQGVREDDSRGRHTTTHRELVLLPQGGLVLDTPGMRTLMLWEADEGMTEVFGDVEQLVGQCRFSDCTHQNEPGCAVRLALKNGTLKASRWDNWLKLQKELRFLDSKKDVKLREERKKFQKSISKYQRSL